MKGRRIWLTVPLALQWMVSSVAAATAIHTVPCMLIDGLWRAFMAIGPSIIGLMFIYGAARYVFSADDPGGRKQGKTMMIHAVIAGIIMALTAAVVIAFGLNATNLCPGIKTT